MAEIIVSPVVEQLVSIMARELEQEVRLVVGVKKEVRKLTSNLTTIKAVLTDAERRQVMEATVKDWLEKLKDVSYDIEDVLDDWEAAILSSQSKPERKVCFLLRSSCFCCKRVYLRHDIARKIKELNERLDRIAQERDRFHFVGSVDNPPSERPMTVAMIDIKEVKGREEQKNELVNMLLSESDDGDRPDLTVVSLQGMPGIGKTTLAQFAFNHDRIKAYFGDNKFWVCVSDPFDEVRVAKDILRRLRSDIPNDADLDYLLEGLRASIEGKRFLLILDDVWEENPTKWNKLKLCLRDGLLGSKVLVTTRKIKVSQNMGCVDNNILQIGTLSNSACWSIIKNIAFLGKRDIECTNLEETFSEEMSIKCKGLPLAAKVLGGILRSRNRDSWQSILNSRVWESEEAEGVIAPIRLSYNDLSPKLKQCFSYCAIFPKDYEFSKCELIELWMAQGYLGQEESDNLEFDGEIYFQNLAMRSFFEDFHSDMGVMMCKMHDIVHDFAQMVARNECCSAQKVDDQVESIRTVRHLCLDLPKHGSYLNSSHILKKMRSLFLWSMCTDELSSSFGKFTHVRSLSLRSGGFEEIPSSIRKLVQLRWLDLSYNEKLKQLPETLCEMHKLQTINVSRCVSLYRLPHGIGKLINLRQLPNLLSPGRLPKGIAQLTGLRTLEHVHVGYDDLFSLGDLKNLNQLRGRLHITKLGAYDRHVDGAKQAELKKKEHITHLLLFFSSRDDKKEENQLLEALEPPPYLEFLQIFNYRGTTFPGWMISLMNLRQIRLGPCPSCEQLPSLGKLPSLEILMLFDMAVKKVGVELLGIKTQIGESKSEISASSSSSSSSSPDVAFPKLIELEFDDMPDWEEWDNYYDGTTKPPLVIQIMSFLRILKIKKCPRLKALPNYILRNTEQLLTLKIENCTLLEERYNKETGDDWSKISHISHVMISSYEDSDSEISLGA